MYPANPFRSLRTLGIASTLTDPVLMICAGSKSIASNDGWETAPNVTAIRKATAAIGTFPLGAGASDAALLLALPPGAYTAEVKTSSAAEGVVLLEIYDVP